MGKDESDSEMPDFSAFSEWSEGADCKNFDSLQTQVVASIRLLLRPYHKPYLERAGEQNTNNARVASSKNIGYLECVEYGWLEEKSLPDGGYKYFALTESGEAALRIAPRKPKPRSVRIASAPPRLAEAPQRLTSAVRKR